VSSIEYNDHKRSPFYQRNQKKTNSDFKIGPDVKISGKSVDGRILSSSFQNSVNFKILFYPDGIFNFKVFEEDLKFPRYTPDFTLVHTLEPINIDGIILENVLQVKFGSYTLFLDMSSLKMQLINRYGVLIFECNRHKLFNFEYFIENPDKNFKSDSHKETSVALDFTFPLAVDVVGLPERSTTLRLPMTKGRNSYHEKENNKAGEHTDKPIRLKNMDVFRYSASSSILLNIDELFF
jgi:hypothetical protein